MRRRAANRTELTADGLVLDVGTGLDRRLSWRRFIERHGDRFVESCAAVSPSFCGISPSADFSQRSTVSASNAWPGTTTWKVVVIASRVDAVRAGTTALEVNPRAIVNVVNFAANLAPETIFNRVYRLVPGTLLLATERETRTGSYWDMRYGIGDDCGERRLAETSSR